MNKRSVESQPQPGWARPVLIALLAAVCVALVLGSVALGAGALSARQSLGGGSVMLARTASASGCPAAAGQPPARGDHCVPLPVAVVLQTSNGANKTCGQAAFLQMKLRHGIVEYGAEWSYANASRNPPPSHPWIFHASGGPNGTGSGPFVGEQTWSTKALTPQNTGVPVHYRVPHGYGAWFLAAGGGPAPCHALPTIQQGWGWTSQPVISGTVRAKCLRACSMTGKVLTNVLVHVRGSTRVDTTTDENGVYAVAVSPGHYSVSASVRGWDFTPRAHSLTVKRSRSHVDFDGCSTATATTARAAAGGAGLITLYAGGNGCANKIRIDYDPATKTARVGWAIVLPDCDWIGGTGAPTGLYRPDPTRGFHVLHRSPVPSQPGDQVISPNAAGGTTVTVNVDGALALTFTIGKNGKAGSVTVGTIDYTGNGHDPCKSHAEVLPLAP